MNLDLINKKVELINKLQNYDQEFQYSVTVNYHGIPLKFETNNTLFIEDLKAELPDNWFSNVIAPTRIKLLSPLEYGFTPDQWCNEESQDCHIEGDIVVHRDFTAIEKPNSIVLLSQERLSDGIYNFLRWLLPKKLLKKQTFVLHSCCIVSENDNANFFLGHSGAGKSTVASFAGARKILGDDMNLLQFNRLKAYPGAIGGLFKQDVNYNDSFDIKAFYWLEQSESNNITQMSTPKAHSKLLASVTNIFWNTLTESEVQKIFEITYNLVTKIPSYHLEFKKDDSFWSLVDAEL